jgi:hypothetical protein
VRERLQFDVRLNFRLLHLLLLEQPKCVSSPGDIDIEANFVHVLELQGWLHLRLGDWFVTRNGERFLTFQSYVSTNCFLCSIYRETIWGKPFSGGVEWGCREGENYKNMETFFSRQPQKFTLNQMLLRAGNGSASSCGNSSTVIFLWEGERRECREGESRAFWLWQDENCSFQREMRKEATLDGAKEECRGRRAFLRWAKLI